jgi:hypothetical protein
MHKWVHTHTHKSNVYSVTSKQEKMETNIVLYIISVLVLRSKALKQEEISQ